MISFGLLGDAAIIAACAAAAAGCFALNRRVRALASTELGIGKALSEMTRAVSHFEALLAAAETSTREASSILDEQLTQARRLIGRLEAIASAASRPAPVPAAVTKPAAVEDPLSDVTPKGFSPTTAQRPPAGRPAANGTAQGRLAELALRRRAAAPNAAAATGKSAP
jgi:hypothetical protein